MSNIVAIKNEFYDFTLQMIKEAKKTHLNGLSAEKIQAINECAQTSMKLHNFR